MCAFSILFAQVIQPNAFRAMDIWHAFCDLEISSLENTQARQMWRDIVVDGKVSPIKPMSNVAYGQRRSHAKPQCTSTHARRRRCVEKIDQTCKAKCINSAMKKINVGHVRFRLRQKCAERCLYVGQVTRASDHIVAIVAHRPEEVWRPCCSPFRDDANHVQ